MPENKTLHSRNEEIVTQFFDFVELHLQNLLNGKETEMFHIKEIAEKLFVSYGHLTNTIKLVTKHHPCYHYDYRIITLVNDLLLNTEKSASEIARTLTFDPSNFVKFYKNLTGITPTEFRKNKILPKKLPIETKKYLR